MQDRGEIRTVHWESAVATLSSIPVIVFGYTCHQNVNSLALHKLNHFWTNINLQMFSILNEIKHNSHFRITSVVLASIGIASSIYVLVAITGYLSFGNAITGNIVGMCRLFPLQSA